jgi:hypothetical protein
VQHHPLPLAREAADRQISSFKPYVSGLDGMANIIENGVAREMTAEAVESVGSDEDINLTDLTGVDISGREYTSLLSNNGIPHLVSYMPCMLANQALP